MDTAVGRRKLEFQVLFYFLNGMPLGSVIFFKETSVNAILKWLHFLKRGSIHEYLLSAYWIPGMKQKESLPYGAIVLRDRQTEQVIGTYKRDETSPGKTKKASLSK